MVHHDLIDIANPSCGLVWLKTQETPTIAVAVIVARRRMGSPTEIRT